MFHNSRGHSCWEGHTQTHHRGLQKSRLSTSPMATVAWTVRWVLLIHPFGICQGSPAVSRNFGGNDLVESTMVRFSDPWNGCFMYTFGIDPWNHRSIVKLVISKIVWDIFSSPQSCGKWSTIYCNIFEIGWNPQLVLMVQKSMLSTCWVYKNCTFEIIKLKWCRISAMNSRKSWVGS